MARVPIQLARMAGAPPASRRSPHERRTGARPDLLVTPAGPTGSTGLAVRPTRRVGWGRLRHAAWATMTDLARVSRGHLVGWRRPGLSRRA
jgi:hypothetical protein